MNEPKKDPAAFITEQNDAGSLLDEILAATSLSPRSEHPTLPGDFMESIHESTARKQALHARLQKAREALEVSRSVRRMQKQEAQRAAKEAKAQAKEAKRIANLEDYEAKRKEAKEAKHNSIVRCMRRGAKLLRFVTGWHAPAKKTTGKRQYRPAGCALMAAIVGRYGSVEAWKKAGSPYGPSEVRKHWPEMTNEEMSRIMHENDACKTTREEQAAKLKAKGF